MLKICFLLKEISLYRKHIEKIINTEVQQKYNICQIEYFKNFKNFLDSEKNILDTGNYKKILIFKEASTHIEDEWGTIFSICNLSIINKPETKFTNEIFTKLQQEISVGLKKINFIASLFNDVNLSTMMILPKKNFSSKILDRIFYAVSNFSSNKNNTERNYIQELLYQFTEEHRTPKRRTRYSKVKYLRRDDNIYFKLGREHHGKSETGHLHNEICVYSGYFRFGIRIDRDLHFNVSSEGDNSHIPQTSLFVNCHGNKHNVKSKTSHLNIFPNDYIR